jgi:putative transcriptional regulator
MLDPTELAAIRKKLGLPQEQIARLLGVSFITVYRWEQGQSSPTGLTLDLYLALNAAMRAGYPPTIILDSANGERSAFLYSLFRMAYGRANRVIRATPRAPSSLKLTTSARS